MVATNQSERGGVENSLVAIAEGTQLVGGLRCFDWSDDGIYQSGVCILTRVAVMIMQALGLQVVMPELQPDAFPFWDSCMMVLSIVAMILMTRKYVENWLLWVIINVISVVIFALQGVYAMSLEYIILTFIALNGSRMGSTAHVKEAHARCPINGDDVNGQTPFIQVAVWPMTRLIFHLNGGVLNLIVIHQVVLI